MAMKSVSWSCACSVYKIPFDKSGPIYIILVHTHPYIIYDMSDRVAVIESNQLTVISIPINCKNQLQSTFPLINYIASYCV